jgi:hypothetical protein
MGNKLYWNRQMPILQVTTRVGCKLACPYCPQDKLIKAYKSRSEKYSLSFDDFCEIVDKLPADVSIWFQGMSEPWLNSDCTKMILYAHDKGYNISVTTTLIGLKSGDIELIETIPFGFFKVHLPSYFGEERIVVDDNYLSVLDKILNSSISTSFHCHSLKTNPSVKLLLKNHDKTINYYALYGRAGNVSINKRFDLKRRRGVIACKRKLENNILLPNGDVLVCSNDYGMKHILGNLLDESYESIFRGNEIGKILKGHQDESIDILCRYCQNFGKNIDIRAKLNNFTYQIDRYIYHLKVFHSVGYLEKLRQKGRKYFSNFISLN